jgi:hypothetical protein
VEQFRDGGEGQFGPAVEPQELSSLSTPIATAEGCNALEDLLTVLDRIDTSKRPATKASKKVVKPVQVSGRRPKPPTLADPAAYRAQIVKGRRRLLEQIAEVSSGPARAGANVDSSSDTRNPKPRGHATQNGPLPVDPLWGGPLEPYALLVQLRLEGENAARSDADHAKRAALEELVASAIQSQEPSGLWPVTEDFMPWTPSVRERGLCMVAPPAKRKAGQRPPAARTKTMPGRGGRGWPAAVSAVTVQQSRTASALQAIRDQIYNDTRFWSVDNEETQRLATAYMLCYLAGTSGSADAPPAASTSSEKKPEAVEEPTPKEDPSPAADPGTH